MIKAITDFFQRNRSIRELAALSDRELADLGIARVDIKTVVLQSQMNRDEAVSPASPRRTGTEKTVKAVESFA